MLFLQTLIFSRQCEGIKDAVPLFKFLIRFVAVRLVTGCVHFYRCVVLINFFTNQSVLKRSLNGGEFKCTYNFKLFILATYIYIIY